MKKAILLCAGLGKRLRPLTDKIPKPLMSINGKPLLSIWLDRLSQFGFESFLINSHYLHEQIESFIETSIYKNSIKYCYEKKILGTAGTILKNSNFLNEGGLVIHADNYCMANFKEFVDVHNNRPESCSMTMMTFKTSSPEKCGIVEIDEKKIVKNFYEKDPYAKGSVANAAIYCLSADMISEIKNKYSSCSDFSTEILPHFMNRIYTYHTKEIVIDIGSPEDYKMAIDLDKKTTNETKFK